MRTLAACSLLFAATLAAAEPRRSGAPSSAVQNEARRRFSRGNALYDGGRYTDALLSYQAAYDLVPSPDILYNLGLAQEKVGNYEACTISLNRYLKSGGDAESQTRAQLRLAACRERTRIPVRVTSLPPSVAVVQIDGDRRIPQGRTPSSLELAPGHYALELATPGYITERRELDVQPGDRPAIDVMLEKYSSLAVESDVAGAQVFIDGAPAGPTPLKREIRAGSYAVRIAHAGYRNVERSVRVESGDTVSLVVTLPPLPHPFPFRLEVAGPRDATLVIDDRPAERAAGVRPLQGGIHRLVLNAPRYEELRLGVQMPPDRAHALRIQMRPVRTRKQWVVFGAMCGLGTAAAAAGLGLGIQALDARDQFQHTPSVALVDQERNYALASDLSFAASAALGLTAVIYLLVTRPPRAHVEEIPAPD